MLPSRCLGQQLNSLEFQSKRGATNTEKFDYMICLFLQQKIVISNQIAVYRIVAHLFMH